MVGRTNGPTDGRTNGRTDRRTDGRTDERTDGRTVGYTDRRTEGRTARQSSDGQTDGRMDGRPDGPTEVEWTDGRTDGRTEGRTDGRTNGRTDGRMDGRTTTPFFSVALSLIRSNRLSFVFPSSCLTFMHFSHYLVSPYSIRRGRPSATPSFGTRLVYANNHNCQPVSKSSRAGGQLTPLCCIAEQGGHQSTASLNGLRNIALI